MAEEKGYNGWSNYETWVVKLWIDNDEGSYTYWGEKTEEIVKDFARMESSDFENVQPDAAQELREALKTEHEEALPNLQGFAADLLNSAFGKVDWYEIAQSMIADYLSENPEVKAEWQEENQSTEEK